MGSHLFILGYLSLVHTIFVPREISAAPLAPVVEVNIGVIVDLSSVAGKMSMASINLALSDIKSENKNENVSLVLHARDSKGDVAALDLLNSLKVHLIIGPQNSYEAPYIATLATTTRVPVLSFTTSWASPSQFPFFVRTSPSGATQSQAIASLISTIRAKGVVLIYGDNHEYTELIHSITKDLGGQKIRQVPISSSVDDKQMCDILISVMEMKGSVYLVHLPMYLASSLFDTARKIGMLSDDYIWITTEYITSYLEATLDSFLFGFMHGVLGVKAHITPSKKVHEFEQRWKLEFGKENVNYYAPLRPTAYEMWAYDTVRAVTIAVNQAIQANYFGDGENLLKLIQKTEFEGISGWFSTGKDVLNPKRDYEIVAVREDDRSLGVWMDQRGIDLKPKRRSLLSATVTGKLRIAIPDSILKSRLFGTNPLVDNMGGFVNEIFKTVFGELHLEYEIVPYVDAQRSPLVDYDELVKQVSLKKYDVAIGDITITANRSSLVDFSQPYLDSSVSMLVPLVGRSPNAWSFLEPWGIDLWLTVAWICFTTGLVLWLLESKTEKLEGQPFRKHFLYILYYSFYLPGAAAISSENGPELSRATSKVVSVVWCFSLFILSSSYTANLTTIFMTYQLKPSVTSIKELMKNQYYVGYLQSSYVKGMLLNMGFDETHLRPLRSFEEFSDALTKGSKNGGVAAIVDELPYLNIFLSYYCCNYTISTEFDTKAGGFGFAFQKGSVIAQEVSTQILNLKENGDLKKIQDSWIESYASSDETDPTTPRLHYHNFMGLFFLVCVVTLAGLFIGLVDPKKLQCLSPNLRPFVAYDAIRWIFSRSELAQILRQSNGSHDHQDNASQHTQDLVQIQ